MRTLIVTGAGLLLAFAFAYASKTMGRGAIAGSFVFIVLWFIFCCIDLANGVKSGYAALDELGIHILLFTVASLGAWAAARVFE